mmetsp:Transcript_65740/g.157103  ORF Transcript_65740/g.157103 Transcript_65740/m.157103 type:complete len:260 (+) Transcript_65740:747-1526(+)
MHCNGDRLMIMLRGYSLDGTKHLSGVKGLKVCRDALMHRHGNIFVVGQRSYGSNQLVVVVRGQGGRADSGMDSISQCIMILLKLDLPDRIHYIAVVDVEGGPANLVVHSIRNGIVVRQAGNRFDDWRMVNIEDTRFLDPVGDNMCNCVVVMLGWNGFDSLHELGMMIHVHAALGNLLVHGICNIGMAGQRSNCLEHLTVVHWHTMSLNLSVHCGSHFLVIWARFDLAHSSQHISMIHRQGCPRDAFVHSICNIAVTRQL